MKTTRRSFLAFLGLAPVAPVLGKMIGTADVAVEVPKLPVMTANEVREAAGIGPLPEEIIASGWVSSTGLATEDPEEYADWVRWRNDWVRDNPDDDDDY